MNQFSAIREAFWGRRVLVVGDVMLDRYVRGRVERISPEAPVPIVALESEESRLGGAANVALNLRALGAEPLVFSVLGQDTHAETLLQLFPENDLSTQGLLFSPRRRTTVKTRVIAQGQHLLRVDAEDCHDLLPEEEKTLLDRIEPHLQTAELLVFQDYNKGTLTPSLIQTLMDGCRTLAIPTAVDPKFRNFWAYRGATLFKPNRREVEAALGRPLPAEQAALREANAALQSRLANELTLITLGAQGLFLGFKGGGTLYPTQPRSITDVCGAGDSVLSIAALSLCANLDLDTLARLANLAGGQVCEKVGVVPLDLQQLEHEFAVFV